MPSLGKVYFCDPYSSMQKGHSENANGMLRQQLLNVSDLSLSFYEEFDDIADSQNKRLGAPYSLNISLIVSAH
mgnify:FL=1